MAGIFFPIFVHFGACLKINDVMVKIAGYAGKDVKNVG